MADVDHRRLLPHLPPPLLRAALMLATAFIPRLLVVPTRAHQSTHHFQLSRVATRQPCKARRAPSEAPAGKARRYRSRGPASREPIAARPPLADAVGRLFAAGAARHTRRDITFSPRRDQAMAGRASATRCAAKYTSLCAPSLISSAYRDDRELRCHAIP